MAEDDGARGAEEVHDVCVAGDDGAEEGAAAGRCLHFVCGGHVLGAVSGDGGERDGGADIFDKDGDAMEGATGAALLALGIESGGYSGGVWVHLDYGAEIGVCLRGSLDE